MNTAYFSAGLDCNVWVREFIYQVLWLLNFYSISIGGSILRVVELLTDSKCIWWWLWSLVSHPQRGFLRRNKTYLDWFPKSSRLIANSQYLEGLGLGTWWWNLWKIKTIKNVFLRRLARVIGKISEWKSRGSGMPCKGINVKEPHWKILNLFKSSEFRILFPTLSSLCPVEFTSWEFFAAWICSSLPAASSVETFLEYQPP